MKLVLIATVAVAIFAANIFGELRISSDVIKQRLHFIGTVEGKSFFFDDENYGDWRAAGNYCALAGMHLASLDTEAQNNLIKDCNDEKFMQIEYYWTSGRDSQDLYQIKWNDTNASASGSTWINVTSSTSPRSCLLLAKKRDGLEFHIVGCQYEYFPLCET